MSTNPNRSLHRLTSLEVCAGAGGLAMGLEQAGFEPVMLIEKRPVVCESLRLNRPEWDVREADLRDFDPMESPETLDVDLLSAGLPRIRAAAAVNRPRGNSEELHVLDATIQLLYAVQPRAVLVENLPELATGQEYVSVRESITQELEHLGYRHRWFVLNAADHGVPQARRQGILVAFKGDVLDAFVEPRRDAALVAPTVGELLGPSMASNGWTGWSEWAAQADKVAPTLVGGSWDRGGPDLGPSGSKQAWARMGVDGATIGDNVPDSGFAWDPSLGRPGMVRLTIEQVAMLQSFPAEWRFAGGKTAQYRQIANASPPPVARALGLAVRRALEAC